MAVSPDLGKNPISTSAISDAELKGSPQYDSMSSEIAKLSSIQDAGHVQWPVVVEAAQHILAEQAKDIPSAVYLAMALAECEGLSGWYKGGRILADVLQIWWDEALPPKKRMRARINAVDWWHERTKQFLSREHAAIEGEMHEAFKNLIHELDGIIGEKLPDCQPLYDVREILQQLDIKETPVAVAAEVLPATEQAQENATQALERTSPSEPSSTPHSIPHPTVPSSASAQSANISPPPVQIKTPPLANAAFAPVQDLPSFDSQDPELVKKCQKVLVQMARQYYDVSFSQACPQEALAWHSLYVSLWGGIEQMPVSQGRNTLVPAPDSARLMALQTLLAAQKFEQAARAATLLVPASLFCLDAHHAIALSLQGLLKNGSHGYAAALAIMEQHVKLFVQRFPGIEDLCFADESPFANEACKAWLTGLQQEAGQSSGQNSEAQTLAGTIADAQRLCYEKQLPQALDVLNTAMKNAPPAAQLRLQTTQVRLLSQEQHFDMAVALTENILKTLDKHQLDQWDKQLCEEVLLVAYAAYKGHEGSQSKVAGIAQRVAVLNPSAALKLV